jgi:hypothetical protein
MISADHVGNATMCGLLGAKGTGIGPGWHDSGIPLAALAYQSLCRNVYPAMLITNLATKLSRYGAVLLLCGCTIPVGAQPKVSPQQVTIEGNDFVSRELPSVRVHVDPKLQYIGSFPFDIDGIAGGYRYVWGEVDHGKHLKRTFIIQMEGFYPTSHDSYRYPTPNPVRLGAHEYQHNVFIADNEAEIREHPGHEPDVTQKFLRSKGYELDSQLVMSRFARIVGEDNKNEIIFFYTENLSAYIKLSAAGLDDSAHENLKKTIKEQVDTKSREAFKVAD